METIQQQLINAKKAQAAISSLSDEGKQSLINDLAALIKAQSAQIISENLKDLEKMPDTDPKKDRLLLNEASRRRHWLAVRLEGVKDNRDGLGTLVTVQMRGQKSLVRQVGSDGGYLSASDSRVYFGLGETPAIESVTVQWPNGNTESWSAIKPDKLLTLRQGAGRQQLFKP